MYLVLYYYVKMWHLPTFRAEAKGWWVSVLVKGKNMLEKSINQEKENIRLKNK